jgi:hypothetical protein
MATPRKPTKMLKAMMFMFMFDTTREEEMDEVEK